MQGWVKLQRSILQQEIRAKPPEYYKIYTYLVVNVDRVSGEFYTTYQQIAEDCWLKKTTVDNFLRRARGIWLLTTDQKIRGVVITLSQNLGFFDFNTEEKQASTENNTTTQNALQITTRITTQNLVQELIKTEDNQPPITTQNTSQNTFSINKNTSTSVEVDRAKALSSSKDNSTSFLNNIGAWLSEKKWWSLKEKKYGDSEVNSCLAIIKEINDWTLEGSQQKNRRYAKLLISKLKQEKGVISWKRTREETLELLLKVVVQSVDTYRLPKLSSPQELYNNLNKLKAFAKAYIAKVKAEKQKEAEKKAWFKSF